MKCLNWRCQWRATFVVGKLYGTTRVTFCLLAVSSVAVLLRDTMDMSCSYESYEPDELFGSALCSSGGTECALSIVGSYVEFESTVRAEDRACTM